MRIERAGCGLAVAVIAARMRVSAKAKRCTGVRRTTDRRRRARLCTGVVPSEMLLFAARTDAVATTDTT